jgi:hypothetical protein
MHRHVFRAKGNFIRTIHATKRYPFLDVDGWEQDTQWRRKQRVVEVVSNILNPAMPGNAFAQRVHDDLTNWHQCPPVQRHDIADAIASASLITTEPCSLCMNADLLQQRIQPTLPQHPSKQHQPRSQPTTSKRERQQQTLSLVELRGKMECTLAQLRIDYYELLRGEPSNSARLFMVYQQDPNNRHLKAFLQALNSYNKRGTDVPNLETIEARLTPLLT